MAKPKDIFLTAKYAAKPRYRNSTSVAGWMKNDNNIQYDEAIDITRGLKDRDLVESRIILNITNQSVVKNTFDIDKTKGFMELFQYFYTNSPQEISQSLRDVGITVEQAPVEEAAPVAEATVAEAEAPQA